MQVMEHYQLNASDEAFYITFDNKKMNAGGITFDRIILHLTLKKDDELHPVTITNYHYVQENLCNPMIRSENLI